jgi:hypothetical protein
VGFLLPMQSFKIPKNNEKYRWTSHIVRKMMHYRLTPSRVLRIVRAPERLEAGVAQGTVAGMQKTGSKQKPTEIWAMWREEKPRAKSSEPRGGRELMAGGSELIADHRKVIITAWRYPGVSPVRDTVPIPEDVLSELRAEGLIDDE